MLMFWKVRQPTKSFRYHFITFATNLKQSNIMEILLTLVSIGLGIWFFGWFMSQWNKLSNVPPTPEQLQDIDWHNTLN